MTMTMRTDIDIGAWLDGLHLEAGSHDAPERGMCVMEAVSWLVGEDFSDQPDCVSPVIRAFSISWNDSLADADRNRLLKPLMIRMAGTSTGRDDELAWMAIDWLVRMYAPAWLRLAGLDDQADTLAELPALNAVTTPGMLVHAGAARDAARAAAAAGGDATWTTAARDAAGYAAATTAATATGYARAAAWYAAGATAGDAGDARDAAGAAATAAGYAGDAAWYAAGATATADAARAAATAAGDAGDAAGAAARDALRPTVVELQDSAVDLLKRMCEHARQGDA